MCVLAFLYTMAERSMSSLPAAAERAMFFATLSQLKSAANLEMIHRLSSGEGATVGAMTGTNPMDYLLEPPINYGGLWTGVGAQGGISGAWYFDAARGELVYVLGSMSRGVVSSAGGAAMESVRLRLVAVPNGSGEHQGVLLVPVAPFSWGEIALDVL